MSTFPNVLLAMQEIQRLCGDSEKVLADPLLLDGEKLAQSNAIRLSIFEVADAYITSLPQVARPFVQR